MKKKLLGLLAVAAVALPLGVGAATLPKEINTKNCQKETKDGFTTYTCPIKVLSYEDNSEENTVVIELSNYGDAVKEVTCGNDETDGFIFDDTNSKIDASSAKCQFTNPDKVTKKDVIIGSIIYTVEDSKVKDDHSNCGLVYAMGSVQGKVNPSTGAELPLTYVLGAIVLAAGVIAVTTKKTKLFNI